MVNNQLTPFDILSSMENTLDSMLDYWNKNKGGWKDDSEFILYKSDLYDDEKAGKGVDFLIDNADDLSSNIQVGEYANRVKSEEDSIEFNADLAPQSFANQVDTSISTYNFKLASALKKAMLKINIDEWKTLDKNRIQSSINNIEKLIALGEQKQDPSDPFDADWIFGKQVLSDTKKFLENCLI